MGRLGVRSDRLFVPFVHPVVYAPPGEGSGEGGPKGSIQDFGNLPCMPLREQARPIEGQYYIVALDDLPSEGARDSELLAAFVGDAVRVALHIAPARLSLRRRAFRGSIR